MVFVDRVDERRSDCRLLDDSQLDEGFERLLHRPQAVVTVEKRMNPATCWVGAGPQEESEHRAACADDQPSEGLIEIHVTRISAT